MALNRKVIHNMEEAAQKLIDYIINRENEQNLIELIAQVDREYKKQFDSYVWSPIYHLFGWRMRTSDVDALSAVVKDENTNARQLLTSIVRFMEKGGWEPTSANTNLMYEMLARLPNYQLSDPDPRQSLTLAELNELHLVFADKAKGIMNAVKGDLTQKDNSAAEVASIPKRDIRQVGAHLPQGSSYKPKEWLPANKSIKSNYKDIMATLSVLLANKAETPVTQSGKIRCKTPVQDLVATPVTDISFDMMSSEKEGFFVIPTPPPPQSQLSSGAFAVTEKCVKGGQTAYVAPARGKLTVTEASVAMANTLFAHAKPKGEIDTPKQTLTI